MMTTGASSIRSTWAVTIFSFCFCLTIVSPSRAGHHQLALASGAYSSGSQADATVAFFPTNSYFAAYRGWTWPNQDRYDRNEPNVRLLYYNFRTNTVGTVATFGPTETMATIVSTVPPYRTASQLMHRPPANIRAVAACSVPNRGSGSKAGTVYVAAVVDYGLYVEDDDAQYNPPRKIDFTNNIAAGTRIHVYRYDPVNGTWPEIAMRDHQYYMPTTNANPSLTNPAEVEQKWQDYANETFDVALCANNSNSKDRLWVFWADSQIGVGGVAIEDPSTRNTVAEFRDYDPEFENEPDNYAPAIQLATDGILDVNTFDADFDFDTVSNNFGGIPRIAYIGDDNGNEGTYLARVNIDTINQTGQPVSLGSLEFTPDRVAGTLISSTGYSPAISLNQAPSASGFRAFSAHYLDVETDEVNSDDVWANELTIVSGQDAWTDTVSQPLMTSEVGTRRWPDVTYRFSGRPRFVNRKADTGSRVLTNTETVALGVNLSSENGELYFPRIVTNSLSAWNDVLCGWLDYKSGESAEDKQHITISILDP